MIPIVKGWSTEMAQQMTSLGVQVHGGMGYIEETGAAQYVRDARITTIYEGTTAIQANDLIGRKLVRDGGQALGAAIASMRDVQRALETAGEELAGIGGRLRTGVDELEAAGRWIVTRFADPRAVLGGAVPFLELAGIVCGGVQLGRAALVAATKLRKGVGDAAFMRAKIATARHFADHCLTQASGLGTTVMEGAHGMLAIADEQF
jgi:3-(methylthio)propanoyl-CoA dehydrogenase